MRIEKREHFRNQMDNPLCAHMTIVKIKDSHINANQTKTCILDIGPGGLRFQTGLKLPVNPYIVLEFETRIMDETVTLPGYLVRRSEQEENLYEYGVKFCFEEYEQMYLTKLLNDMTIRLRKVPDTTACRLCIKKNKSDCLRTLKTSEAKYAQEPPASA